MDVNPLLQQSAPGITIIGISLNLLFQGHTLARSRTESTRSLGLTALAMGIPIAFVGVIVFSTAWGDRWWQSILWLIVSVFVVSGIYFALKKKTLKIK